MAGSFQQRRTIEPLPGISLMGDHNKMGTFHPRNFSIFSLSLPSWFYWLDLVIIPLGRPFVHYVPILVDIMAMISVKRESERESDNKTFSSCSSYSQLSSDRGQNNIRLKTFGLSACWENDTWMSRISNIFKIRAIHTKARKLFWGFAFLKCW